MKQTLLSFLLVLLPLVASADTVEIDGIYYNLINKTKNAEVTSNPNGYSGDIVIPETVIKDNIEYKVTSIKSFTFYNEYNLGSITIPPSITHIGGGAFTCSTVSAVYISDLEAWINIKFDSIDEGEGFLETNPLANAHRLYLNGVEIKDLVIPNTIEKIGKLVFPNLDRLESITIPESVKEIGDYAFYGCRNLTSISIPKSLMSIGTGAFFNCSGLSSVHISDLESWCNIKFGDNPLNYAHHLVMNGTEIKDLVIPKSVTSIGLNSFMGCSGLTSIAIHNHVTSIGDGAFQGCTGLTSILIPNSVTTIGGSAFSGCSSLKSINIPNSVTTIEGYAFENCSSLTSLDIPNSVTYIGQSAFGRCNNLSKIIIGSGVNYYGDGAFANCPELTDFFCYAITPSGADYLFDGSYIQFATLHVPESAIEAYRNAAPWNNFKSIVSITDTDNYYEMAVTVNNAHGTVVFGDNSLTDGTQTYNVKEGTDVALTLSAEEGYKLASVTVDGTDKTADVVEGVLTISNVTADLTVDVKFATAGETVTATIGTAGIATFCSAKDLDFSEVDGLTAYTGAGFNRETGVLTMLKVTDAPAGTGLVLTGSKGTYEVPVKTSASVYANLLVGVTEETTLSQTDGGYVNYILGDGSHGLGFYIVSGEGQLAAGKAYLRLPAVVAGESRAISITFADDATGIEGISGDSKATTDEWRDLQGRRIMQPTKAGIYLKDGRKIVVR